MTSHRHMVASLPQPLVALLPRNLRAPLACLGVSIALGASGCHKDKPPEETKTSEAKPAPEVKADVRKPSLRTQPDEGVEVPTEEDFEEQTEKQITADSNLQKELDQLEKQISGG